MIRLKLSKSVLGEKFMVCCSVTCLWAAADRARSATGIGSSTRASATLHHSTTYSENSQSSSRSSLQLYLWCDYHRGLPIQRSKDRAYCSKNILKFTTPTLSPPFSLYTSLPSLKQLHHALKKGHKHFQSANLSTICLLSVAQKTFLLKCVCVRPKGHREEEKIW